jgi:hypothetical protein
MLSPRSGRREKILSLENYVGKGASEQQFVKIFTESGIRVVFRRDLLIAHRGRSNEIE